MKSIAAILAVLLCYSSLATATTIVAAGGTTGFQFMTPPGHLLNPINARIEVGSFHPTTGLWTQFAPNDSTPPTFGTASVIEGRWNGSATDISSAANSFTGNLVWFKVTVLYQWAGNVVGYFSDGVTVFPANGGGVGDTVNVNSRNLNTIGSGSFIGAGIVPDPDGSGPLTGKVIIGYLEDVPLVPEPSIAALSALGFLFLIRRRR